MTKQFLILPAFAALAAVSVFAQAATGWTSTFSTTGYPHHLDGQSGVVPGRPFSGTEIHSSTQTLSDGTHVDHSDRGTVSRDERGRLRIDSGNSSVLVDPVGGFTYTLHPAGKTYEKQAIPAHVDSYVVAHAGNRTSVSSTTGTPASTRTRAQTVTEDLPPQMMNGLNVRGSRVTTTVPAGTMGNDREFKIVNERWYSEDLQVLVKSTNSDPRFGVSSYELTNITQGAANGALFQVPVDYTLRQGHMVNGMPHPPMYQ
uniref:Uncharacterized protein n=1 Tax=Solibacter usitatus (strain Ellin6076) TaxID=234267 RepID=Q024N9_SOLUE